MISPPVSSRPSLPRNARIAPLEDSCDSVRRRTRHSIPVVLGDRLLLDLQGFPPANRSPPFYPVQAFDRRPFAASGATETLPTPDETQSGGSKEEDSAKKEGKGDGFDSPSFLSTTSVDDNMRLSVTLIAVVGAASSVAASGWLPQLLSPAGGEVLNNGDCFNITWYVARRRENEHKRHLVALAPFDVLAVGSRADLPPFSSFTSQGHFQLQLQRQLLRQVPRRRRGVRGVGHYRRRCATLSSSCFSCRPHRNFLKVPSTLTTPSARSPVLRQAELVWL
jgi:hypothetical protein